MTPPATTPPGAKPGPVEVKALRQHLGLTLREASGIVWVSLRQWQKWETTSGPNASVMPAAAWELFLIKTGLIDSNKEQ